jgi:hypothetical protein
MWVILCLVGYKLGPTMRRHDFGRIRAWRAAQNLEVAECYQPVYFILLRMEIHIILNGNSFCDTRRGPMVLKLGRHTPEIITDLFQWNPGCQVIQIDLEIVTGHLDSNPDYSRVFARHIV